MLLQPSANPEFVFKVVITGVKLTTDQGLLGSRNESQLIGFYDCGHIEGVEVLMILRLAQCLESMPDFCFGYRLMIAADHLLNFERIYRYQWRQA